MQEQMTIDSLLGILTAISEAGHGSMPIFIGEKYPLLDSALICLLYTSPSPRDTR